MIKSKDEYMYLSRIFDKDKLIALYEEKYRTDLIGRIEIIYILTVLGYYSEPLDMSNKLRADYGEKVFEYLKWYKLNLNFAFKENDAYKIKKIIKLIIDNFENEHKFLYDIRLAKDFSKQLEIYNNFILPKIRKITSFFSLNKDSNFNSYLTSYLQSLYLSDKHARISWIERLIAKKVKRINLNELTIYDLAFLENASGFIVYGRKNQSKTMQLECELDILLKFSKFAKTYFIYYSGKSRAQLGDHLIEVNKLLFEDLSKKEYLEENMELIKKHGEYLSYSYQYFNEILKNDGEVNYLEYVKKAIENNNITDIIRICINKFANDRYKEVLEIENLIKLASGETKEVLEYLLTYANFITNGCFISESYLDKISNYFTVPDIIRYSILYINKSIDYQIFVDEIKTSSQFNITFSEAKRIINIFRRTNDFEWLIIMINKQNRDLDFIKICGYIVEEILNDNIIIKFSDVDRLFEPMVYINDSSLLTYILYIYMKFRIFSEVAKQIFQNSVNLINIDEFQDKHIVIYNYLVSLLQFSDIENIISIVDKIESIIYTFEDNIKLPMILVLSQKKKDILEQSYKDIIKYLVNQYMTKLEYTSDLELYLIQLMITSFVLDNAKVDIDLDRIYLCNDQFYAISNNEMDLHYNKLNIATVKNVGELLNSEHKLSLMGFVISKIAFENPEKFGMKKISISQEATGKEILESLERHVNPPEKKNMIENLLNGDGNILILNLLYIDRLFKEIQSCYNNKKNRIFNNINNDIYLINNPKIIHPTTLMILSVIDALKVIENNNLCYTIGSFFDEIVEKYTLDTIDLADGILSEPIYIDDSLERLCKTLITLKEMNKVIYFSEGDLFSKGSEGTLNKFDKEILKVIVEKQKENFVIITDDKFYHENKIYSLVSGVYSLIVEAFTKEIINEIELYEYTNRLFSMNYQMLFSNNLLNSIFNYYEKENSVYLEETLKIINKSK